MICLNCILVQRFKLLSTNRSSFSNIAIKDLKKKDPEINGFDKCTHAFKCTQATSRNKNKSVVHFFPQLF